ncbi:rod shape-determining protein MreD [Gorillibacterium sp. sgz500922]|uniref:rod shape-determining protein MreD n=1 Tax=Gorillibacterium sp. sgz500922 TaxID=3446694 RepID=UPI003F675E67
MRRSLLVLIMLAVFLIEGTWVNWLLPADWQSRILVAPHLVLLLVIFIGVYWNRHYGLFFGLGFGLLHDIVFYGPMIGTFCFGYGLVGYAAGLFPFRTERNILTTLFIVAAGNFGFEWLIYGIYRLMNVIHTRPEWSFLHHILPSIAANLLVAIVFYVPLRKLMERVRRPLQVKEQE